MILRKKKSHSEINPTWWVLALHSELRGAEYVIPSGKGLLC